MTGVEVAGAELTQPYKVLAARDLVKTVDSATASVGQATDKKEGDPTGVAFLGLCST